MPANPILGSVMMFSGPWTVNNYAMCTGQLLAISQFNALYSLLGTTYGGDNRTTFGVPDCRGRLVSGSGAGPGLTPRIIGQRFGHEQVTITTNQMPYHTHTMNYDSTGTGPTNNPNGNLLNGQEATYVTTSDNTVQTNPSAIGFTGGSQPHDNLMPMASITFQMALYGIYPSRP